MFSIEEYFIRVFIITNHDYISIVINVRFTGNEHVYTFPMSLLWFFVVLNIDDNKDVEI